MSDKYKSKNSPPTEGWQAKPDGVVLSPQTPTGYKHTEIGLLPEDWEVVPLREVAQNIQRGASPRPIDNPIWFDESSQTGWLRISDVSKAKKYLLNTVQNMSSAGIENSRFVAKNNLVMSICATVGRPIITKKDVCIHDGFVVFKNLNSDINYIYYVLTDIEKNWGKQGQTGSQMNLNTNLINITKIPLPPTLAEQEKIATALSNVDDYIGSLEKLIEKKRNIKQGAMQRLLNPFDDNGKVKEGWQEKCLGDIGFFLGGGTPNTMQAEYWNGDIPWISSSDIFEDNIKKIHISRYINKKALQESATKIIPKNSILIVSRVGVGKIAISNQEICTSQDFCNFVPTNQLSEYVALWLLFHKQNLISLCQGTSIKGLTSIELKNLKISLPPTPAEQEKIASVLSDMDSEIEVLEVKLAKVKNIKQGMMQKLLTGQIRLVGKKNHPVTACHPSKEGNLEGASCDNSPPSEGWQASYAGVVL